VWYSGTLSTLEHVHDTAKERPMSTIATVATDGSSAPGDSRRGRLTADQRDAIRRRLKRLTALEVNPAKRAAGVHLAPVAAYGIATRDAALDALAKLDDGTYGDCETCGWRAGPRRGRRHTEV
jgi:hypothetical protein